jgi:hypothetical protein
VRNVLGRCDIDDADAVPIGTLRSPPRDIYEDISHQPCRHRDEVRSILPTDVLPLQQSDERLVHQRRCLQHMSCTLTSEIQPSKPAKLSFDERDELIKSRTVSVSPRGEQFGDLRRRSRRFGLG